MFAPLHSKTAGTTSVGQALALLKRAHGLEFPRARELPVCFPFIMESGCTDIFNPSHPGSKNKPTVACTKHRLHLSLKEGDTEYTKAELLPLMTFLKNEHVAKIFLPTPEFKKFMS